jgi:hypothetical protein
VWIAFGEGDKMGLPGDYQQKVIEALGNKKINVVCELCSKNNWAVADQPVSLPITDLSGSLRIPTPQIPVAALICNNCGNVRIFALGVLGLLPKE